MTVNIYISEFFVFGENPKTTQKLFFDMLKKDDLFYLEMSDFPIFSEHNEITT